MADKFRVRFEVDGVSAHYDGEWYADDPSLASILADVAACLPVDYRPDSEVGLVRDTLAALGRGRITGVDRLEPKEPPEGAVF